MIGEQGTGADLLLYESGPGTYFHFTDDRYLDLNLAEILHQLQLS